MAGAVSFISGSTLLFPQNSRFIWVAAPLSILFCATTLLLTNAARRARENKWAAVPEEE